jgi:hypothetical protein
MTDPDAQRRAFADAGHDDWTPPGRAFAGALVHDPDDPKPEPIKTPEDWDAEGWDADRDGPKSVGEARAALATRISDPHAPDTPAVAGAYDRLED